MKTGSAILAIDTASAQGIIALQTRDGRIFTASHHEPMGHNAFILPTIEALLKDAGMTFTDVDYLACGVGPGSFVGTRLAVAVMQGLAYALRIPVIPLSHLHLLAQAAWRTTGASSIAIAVDARMQAFYFAEFCHDKRSETLQRVGLEQLHRLSDLSTDFKPHCGKITTRVGSGWSLLQLSALETPVLLPSDLLSLAEQGLATGQIFTQAQDLLPTYLNDTGHFVQAKSL